MSCIISKNTQEKLNVSKILCLGMNYDRHITELNSIKPESPVIFMKPPSSIIHDNQQIILPKISDNVHHELEIVMVISKKARNISIENAMDYVEGFAIGLDLTLRDIQSEAKKKGHPWTIAKGFDTSAPISQFIPKNEISDLNNIDIKLYINEQMRQHGNSRDMIYKFSEIVSYLSGIFTLEKGDLIYTGTPEGVGKLKHGDQLKAVLNDSLELNVTVVNEE